MLGSVFVPLLTIRIPVISDHFPFDRSPFRSWMLYAHLLSIPSLLFSLPLVFIKLKAVSKKIRADENLTDYLHEDSIAHAFHHNAILVVNNGDQARDGSITSKWEHFV